MGEVRRGAWRVGFDRAIKLEFHRAKVSSDACLFPDRDLDEAGQLTDSGAAELFDLLEAEGYEYVIRLKANQVLERHIGHLLTRPVGRSPKRPQRFYHSFDYQAKSLDHHAPRGGHGPVARRRIVSAHRLHRDKPRRRGRAVASRACAQDSGPQRPPSPLHRAA